MYLCNFFSLHIPECTVNFVPSEFRKIKTKALKTIRSLLPSKYFHMKFYIKCSYCLQESVQQKVPGISGSFSIKLKKFYLK